LIIEEWKKRCYQKERKRRIEEKSVFMVSNAKNRLVNALNKLVKKEIKSADIKKPNIGFINKEAAKKQLEIA
jgi:precorrin isomerase